MSYKPHNFKSGGKIYASHFNEMDAQIVLNVADIADLLRRVEALEKSGGGGGGGDTSEVFASYSSGVVSLTTSGSASVLVTGSSVSISGTTTGKPNYDSGKIIF